MSTDEHLPDQQYWSWNGSCWVPAHPTGTHTWDGASWRPRERLGLWQPPWSRPDSIRLVLWAVVAPAALIGVTVAVTLVGSLHGNAVVSVALGLYSIWLIAGGATLRYQGRFCEQVAIAAVTVTVLAIATIVWSASVISNPGNLAFGLSVVLGFASLVYPTLLLLGAGRVARTRFNRRGNCGLGADQRCDLPHSDPAC